MSADDDGQGVPVDDVIPARPLSRGDELVLAIAAELAKTSLDHLWDVNKQIVSLTAVLLGGTVAFIDTTVLSRGWKNAVSMAFFLALVIGAFGLFPFSREIDETDITAARSYLTDALTHRHQLVRAGCTLLLLGFVLTLVGMNVTAWPN